MRARMTALVLVALMVASTLVVAPVSAGEEDGTRWGPGFDASQDYVVVAPEGWLTTLQPLLDWRNRTTHAAYEMVFISLEDANANGDGHDRAARIKDSVRKASPDSSIFRALLLVGDSEVIPVRWVFTDILQNGNLSDPLNFRWTDDYYNFGVESDWDRDGDHVYGEDGEVLDEIVSVFHRQVPEGGGTYDRLVGRIPASNELVLERFIDKLLAYERSPPPGDWYTSALLISGLMDVPNYLDNPFTTDIDGGYELFSDNSYESHSKLVDLLPDSYDTTWLWDYPFIEGGDWNRSVDTLDHDSAVASFDQGHSIVSMNGHGWVDGTGLAHYNGSGYSNYWWDWHNAYDYADADNASNGGKLPWAYVAACYVGDVTLADDRSLERWVMNPDGGAIGLVAGNGENYKGESMANASFGNWFLERNFWNNYFKAGPGEALRITKQDYLALVSSDKVPHPPLYDAYYIADYLSPNLLGDPLTRVWTDEPKELQVVAVEDDVSTHGDFIRVRITDGEGNALADALVDVRWDGGSSTYTTDDGGWVGLRAPLDAGELDILVTGKNLLPLEVKVDRPIELPDILVSDMEWNTGTVPIVWNEPPLEGEEVTLKALIEAVGRYEYDQARVRFSVAPEGGEMERLIPEVFVPIETGSSRYTEHTWTPAHAGRWTVRVEVDPEGDHANANSANDVLETEIMVRGPPVWTDLPASIQMNCGGAPGQYVDLLEHLTDPDTPLSELELSVEVLDGPVEGLTVLIDPQGRLVVCSDKPSASATLLLSASDGTYIDEAEVMVGITRSVARMRIVGQATHTQEQGVTSSSELIVQNLGPGPGEDVIIVEVVDHPDFQIDEENKYTFRGTSPGTHIIWLALERADGTSEEGWQGLALMFVVEPGPGEPPQAYNWQDIEIAEGQKATVHLQALDWEGGVVTYSIVSDDGVDITIDAATGVLTLHPSSGDVGKHEIEISMSDGSREETATLTVFVTETPSSFMLWGMTIAIFCALAIALLFVYLWYRQREDDVDGE